ncbi:hypothetical protein B0H19DRAFT_1259797 [Mycena capillaripes]|nr:hypothetical protein B0H19DRAFT_1259797 [Mycena capillaripes]
MSQQPAQPRKRVHIACLNRCKRKVKSNVRPGGTYSNPAMQIQNVPTRLLSAFQFPRILILFQRLSVYDRFRPLSRVLQQTPQVVHIPASDCGPYRIRPDSSLTVFGSPLEDWAVENLAHVQVDVPRTFVYRVAHKLKVATEHCSAEHVSCVTESEGECMWMSGDEGFVALNILRAGERQERVFLRG